MSYGRFRMSVSTCVVKESGGFELDRSSHNCLYNAFTDLREYVNHLCTMTTTGDIRKKSVLAEPTTKNRRNLSAPLFVFVHPTSMTPFDKGLRRRLKQKKNKKKEKKKKKKKKK